MSTNMLMLTVLALATAAVCAQDAPEADTLPAAGGDLRITFIGHGSLMFSFAGKVVHVDPYHYGDTDAARLVSLLRDTPAIEVRVRRMK